MVPGLPAPYEALVWYLVNRTEENFIGNPVRHFQHLASRMSGQHSELRSWRAWACYHLALKLLPSHSFPCDLEQIEKEGLVIPAEEEVLKNIPSSDSSSLPAAQALARTHSVTHP